MMGVPFIVASADIDEHLSGEPREVVMQLAKRKALAVAEQYPKDDILAADTLVHCSGETLGKPTDQHDAERMLRMLSGNTHSVYTGVCLLNRGNESIDVRFAETSVRFIKLTDQAIERYISTGEPLDKAGAYGIQGMAGMFISEINGSSSNVIGLPMHLVREMLISAGWQL